MWKEMREADAEMEDIWEGDIRSPRQAKAGPLASKVSVVPGINADSEVFQ